MKEGQREEGTDRPNFIDQVYNLSSASDLWEYTKSCFKENAKVFSKNSTTQENITILRLK